MRICYCWPRCWVATRSGPRPRHSHLTAQVMSERVVPNSTRIEFLSKAIRHRLGQISQKMKFHLAVINSRGAGHIRYFPTTPTGTTNWAMRAYSYFGSRTYGSPPFAVPNREAAGRSLKLWVKRYGWMMKLPTYFTFTQSVNHKRTMLFWL